ncbi:MAG: hydroxylamine reductase, partial [Eubacterium sp.]|nr:hydroxylamine reductase [Eubacterium sp.]
MFCYQCQETMGGKGCERSGVCGKKQDLAVLMDLLLWVTKGLGAVTTQLRKEKKAVLEEVNRQVRKNLCMTQTNTNFDKTAIEQAV